MGACVRYYHSRDGDTLDSIAYAVYGRQDAGLVEGLFEANRGVAALGPVLMAGIRLAIPDAPEAPIAQEVRLWG